MIIITTHSNTDFDGLASMVAAQKLYPGSVIVLPGKVNFLVREFLSLYKSFFDIVDLEQVDRKKVTRVILVDTRRRERIGAVAELIDNKVPVTVYDHHESEKDDIIADQLFYDKVGAAVTLLLERLIEQHIYLSSVEATVCALGIYDDTGNLLYPLTTARDLRAAAFLLDQGANLEVTADFLGRPLSEQQRFLLQQLLNNRELINYNGFDIMVSYARTDDYIGGIPIILKKITNLERVDMIFTLSQMGNRIHLVARSYETECDIREVVRHFGGKGHSGAAAAVIKEGDLLQLFAELKKIIPQKLQRPLLVGELMTSPVKTVTASMPIRDVRKTMRRYGHSGLPVVDDTYHLVGIISNSDIEKAEKHNLEHAPVKGFMSKDVIVAAPTLTLHDVQQIMINKDIGRIPVVADGKLVGIISRSDIVGKLHGGESKTKIKKLFTETKPDLSSPVEILGVNSISDEYRHIFKKVGFLAGKNNMQVYLVGGIVRDLLLQVSNDDVDLVVEGDAVELAHLLAQELDGRLQIHERFKTATVYLASGQRIDLVTARMEYYQFPAALPDVEISSLKQDLYRRDYTINAMAISLNSASFGQVIDYYGGRMDLNKGKIRVLHDKSFVEDPTRILRAIRFEKRYDFRLEYQTEILLREAVSNNMLEELSSGRIRHELLLIMKESKAADIVERMNELNIWERVMPEIPFDGQAKQLLLMVQLKRLEMHQYNLPTEHEWLYQLIPLTSCCSGNKMQQLLERDCFTRYERIALQDSWAVWTYTVRHLSVTDNILLNSDVYHLLEPVPLEALPFVAVVAETMGNRQMVSERINWYLTTGRLINLDISGDDLQQLGLSPSPIFRQILREIKAARLNGQVNCREEELQLLYDIVQRNKGFYNV